jgi:hypothetical protein
MFGTVQLLDRTLRVSLSPSVFFIARIPFMRSLPNTLKLQILIPFLNTVYSYCSVPFLNISIFYQQFLSGICSLNSAFISIKGQSSKIVIRFFFNISELFYFSEFFF